ncbi:pyruvate dehydrogenase (acetyl-transferring) E1 component subunit alpha [bacterium]|nr:pyruvate dehydrogenase (acetyl-transferring) E1 component subunit alpha [bacterium]
MPRKTIAEFKLEYLQILDETGKLDAKLEPKLDDAHLLEIYRYMTLAREGDKRMLNLQRQGRIGTFGPSTGQEAIAVTTALAMNDEDWLVGAFRELGARLVRGETLLGNLLLYNGCEEGNAVLPAEKRVLPISIIIATQNLQAVGLGYAMKYKGDQGAVVSLMGDGATSEGDFHEAMNFASVWRAPVVFISQNNQWAISVPREKQMNSRTIAQKGFAYDMPCIQVDGNDALAMHVAMTEALERARAGEGPTFIEAVTYRLMMHTTADDPRKYRSEAEENEWWEKEPIKRFRAYLEQKGLWDDKREDTLHAEIKAQIDADVKEFESRTDFKPDAPFDYVYADEHPEIETQRAEFLEAISKEANHG